MNHRLNRIPGLATLAVVVIAFFGATSQKAAAQDLQELYYKASELAQSGKFEEAIVVYDQIIADLGEFSWDDYGPVFGGVYYDRGICLLQLKQYDLARTSFQTCHESYPPLEKVPYGGREKASDTKSENMRWELAVFQWAFCEQQLGNFETALELYDKFLALEPDPTMLRPIQAALALRRGTSLIGAGRMDEGQEAIIPLFEDYAIYNASGQLLFQAMLEMAIGWIQSAEEDPVAMSQRANQFFDTYGSLFSISPYDKAQLGFIERLRLIGYRAHEAGLHDVALRFFSMVPTTNDILDDLRSRAAQTGGTSKARFEEKIAEYEEILSQADPPDVETLRLIAAAWERLGNRRAGFVINRYLLEEYPDSTVQPILLHEAARYAFALGDAAAAQYYGEQFMDKFPDHELRENVATFMLQSLFRTQQYDVAIQVSQNVRAKFEPGAPERELADFIFGASNYYLNKPEEAMKALDAHVAAYPESDNRESARFFTANSRILLSKFSEAAPLYDSFLQDYKESTFRDQALFDRATCYYIADDYISTLQTLDKLFEEHPESNAIARGYLLKGDTTRAMSDTPEEGKELQDYQREAVAAYEMARDAADRLEQDAFKGEALFKISDVSVELENWTAAVTSFDAFFPDHKENFWTPQMAVFSLPALVEVGRVEDGLNTLEQVIKELSVAEPSNPELLQQAIGSFQEASVEHRGPEATIAKYKEMAQGANFQLQTWLMIHEIIVRQGVLKKIEDKEGAAALAEKSEIDSVFNNLKTFDKKQLSDIALKALGEYLEEQNPFEAKLFFDELLLRDNDLFKAPAEMALAKIEMRSSDRGDKANAVERFKRVITQYGSDPAFDAEKFKPEAHVNIGVISIDMENFDQAIEYLGDYINNKRWDSSRKDRRAQAQFLYALAQEKNGDLDEATRVYLATFGSYTGFPEWSAQAVENGFNISFNRDYDTPEEQAEARLKAYKFLRRVLYIWQKVPDGDFESLDNLRRMRDGVEADLGLSPTEIQEIEFEMGLDQPPAS